MNKVTKAPSEIIPHTIDWSQRVPVGSTLSSCSATCLNLKTLVTNSVVFVSASGVVSALLTSWRLTGGTDGDIYKLILSTTDSLGNVYTQGQLLEIREEVI